MANQEQLKILKQGVKIWNQWREAHPEIEIDLSEADLFEVNLTEANLREVNLQNARLRKANLNKANLYRAQLYRADFCDTHLYKTDLREADLRRANLYKALIDDTTKIDSKWKLAWELVNVKSRKCHVLNGVDLSWTNLSDVDLRGADLCEADLTEANLWKATLDGADMEGAILERANLQCAIFRGANLRHTNLRHANLTEASLVVVDLSGALLTGAKLYGAAHDDWIITGIECEYIFWDQDTERTPPDRDFRPGEFAELYAQLPEITYYFVQGFTAVDAVVMSKVVDTINQQNPKYDLKLDSFHSRGQPHAKFTIRHREDADKVLKLITESYTARITALEAQREQLMQVIAMLGSGTVHINIDNIGHANIQMIAGDTYINQGQAGSIGREAQASENTFQQQTKLVDGE